jgi:3'-5' exoribonuclease
LCEYKEDGDPTENMYLLGHIYMSANYLNGLLREAGVDKKEMNYIIHCILAHHGEMEYGSPVIPCTPDAQLITYLDNISAKADVFNTTGNMEKAFALGTHVVK